MHCNGTFLNDIQTVLIGLGAGDNDTGGWAVYRRLVSQCGRRAQNTKAANTIYIERILSTQAERYDGSDPETSPTGDADTD